MSLDWSDHNNDWQRKYFNLPARHALPSGYRSHARQQWDDALERHEQGRQAQRQAFSDHQAALAERETVETWADLVRRFGSETVEALQRRVDATFTLPACLRGIARAASHTVEEEE